MTPRKPPRTDPITWEGIELAILAYDQDHIIPRQDRAEAKRDKQHEDNKAELEKLNVRLTAIENFFKEWKNPAKFVFWLIAIGIPIILAGVSALVFDLIKWGIANNWKWG